ncbi:succinate dehydrogenase assembly factor 3, mitochondrial [Chrysoperla carnea]|uniref:succinate dehydrogenase assembly factor 3, mitochondrial n=1 Tax=Chrysoperla carnea TaxID=189513 RepID=UPI001D066C8C|nr:succinate dehydrogenase assembly factor 3, mitochondrial [Chrysoperla carnea]
MSQNLTTHTQKVKFLYKTILKLHRGLPQDIQLLGSIYVRDEFRRHKNCNQAEAAVFINEWTDYAINLGKQLGLRGPKTAKKIGKPLDPTLLEGMREDQIVQLYDLMEAAQPKTK